MRTDEIYAAIDSGKEVNWHNSLYYVHKIETEENQYTKPTQRGKYALRITCKSNGFGCVAAESELKDCYIKK